jgi:hypothetical protein
VILHLRLIWHSVPEEPRTGAQVRVIDRARQDPDINVPVRREGSIVNREVEVLRASWEPAKVIMTLKIGERDQFCMRCLRETRREDQKK